MLGCASASQPTDIYAYEYLDAMYIKTGHAGTLQAQGRH